jgi:transcriptional regulator with XRE-family HTH domain
MEKMTLSQARLRRLWSIHELSEVSGVAVTTIIAIERNELTSHPQLRTIKKLAAALGVDPQDVEWPGDPLGELREKLTAAA